MKNILIINGHPNKKSYCHALAEAYATGASSAGNPVVLLHLSELRFNFNLADGYSKKSETETDLLMAQEKIKWAQHIVVVHPVWWGSVPAILKGFFDKTLLPGFAFKYRDKGPLWDKLLSGRTAHIIYTTDTPVWFYRYFYKAPSLNQVKDRTLGFCGIKTIKVAGIGPIRKSQPAFRQRWLEKIKQAGTQV